MSRYPPAENLSHKAGWQEITEFIDLNMHLINP